MIINYKSTQLKVIVGYILLSLLLIFSVSYIYRKMNALTEAEGYEQHLNEQRRITYRAMTQLYQAEIIGQSVSAGQVNEFYNYQKALNNSHKALKEMQRILIDSIQIKRLDTITWLLKQKEWNMYNLLQAMNESNTGEIYHQKIEKIIQEQDTTIQQEQKKVQKKIVVHENSYAIKKKRQGFFKRLAQVFVPPKEDTTVLTNTQRELITDTLINTYNPADSVATILRTIQTQVSDSISHIQSNIQTKINRFKHIGWDLSFRMNQILQTFEKEEQDLINQRLLLEQNIRNKSTRIIAIVAIVAIILVAVFLFFIERDIMRSNHYRNELEKAKRHAENLLVAREKFMITITHDIKAPIGSILGYIDLMTRLLKEERPRFYLQNMKSSANHLLNLVSSLLDFHKLESHKMEINQVPFNPNQLFQTIYTSFQPLAEKKALQLFFYPDEKLNRFYMGDPFRIRQIADNLLSNALKFTQKGHITIQTKLYDGKFCFSVSDTGSGIPEEEKEHMFEEFTRLQNAQGEEGFGMGLAITQRLVILMNGSITVDSEIEKGSSFTISLPIKLASGELLKNISETEGNNSRNSLNENPINADKKIKLLFIDDDRIQLELTQAMLNHPSLEIFCCNNPDILFQQLKEQNFDLLFTDIQMPSLNGFELLKKLRDMPDKQAQKLPIVALTARCDIEEKLFTSQGFAACLHKPYSKTEVIRLIEKLCNRKLEENHTTSTSHKNLGVFNFSALTIFSEDDPEASAEIIRSFIQETQNNKQKLEEALRIGDCKQIKAIAHKQLPLFKMLEAHDCIPLLTWLEHEEYKEIDTSIAEKINIVLQQIEKIIREAKINLAEKE